MSSDLLLLVPITLALESRNIVLLYNIYTEMCQLYSPLGLKQERARTSQHHRAATPDWSPSAEWGGEQPNLSYCIRYKIY